MNKVLVFRKGNRILSIDFNKFSIDSSEEDNGIFSIFYDEEVYLKLGLERWTPEVSAIKVSCKVLHGDVMRSSSWMPAFTDSVIESYCSPSTNPQQLAINIIRDKVQKIYDNLFPEVARVLYGRGYTFLEAGDSEMFYERIQLPIQAEPSFSERELGLINTQVDNIPSSDGIAFLKKSAQLKPATSFTESLHKPCPIFSISLVLGDKSYSMIYAGENPEDCEVSEEVLSKLNTDKDPCLRLSVKDNSDELFRIIVTSSVWAPHKRDWTVEFIKQFIKARKEQYINLLNN
jgi:hypothetical protein